MSLLWAVAHELESTSKYMHATLGVTGPQRLVLRLVGHYGNMSAGELSQTLRIHPSSLTGTLRRLEEAGLLERSSHPQDGRRAVLKLSARGRRLNAKISGTVEAVVEDALRSVPRRDIQATERTLTTLTAEFEHTRTRRKKSRR